MNILVVGINYSDNGDRVISRMYYNDTANIDATYDLCTSMERACDEVYITDKFNPAHKDFINEIVTSSCKFSVDKKLIDMLK